MTFHTAADYTPEQTELIRAATLTAATILGDYMDDLVVVGGLCPAFLFPQRHSLRGPNRMWERWTSIWGLI
jgi:hypothetical protein